MKQLYVLLGTGLAGLATPAVAQDLTNAGSTITVQPGTALYVGTGGLSNQAGSVLTNSGTLRVDGPLTNPGTLDLSTGTLEVRGDFTNTGTITPGTSLVTFSGPADQLLTPGGSMLYQLLLNKPTAGTNTLRLAGDLTVSNLLSLTNGLVNTKNGSTVSTLRLPNGATLTGEAPGRYVIGALEVTRSTVVGSTLADFSSGATINPQGNALGTVVVTRTAGLLTAGQSFGQNLGDASKQGIDLIWTVAAASQPAVGQPVQLTLSWLADNDHGLTDFSQARMWQQTADGQPWASVGPAAAGSVRSLTMNPTVLNRFTVSNAVNPLPVTLVDFQAQAEGPTTVHLAWATASELNNVSFTVERSLDGRTFAAVGTLVGAGTSTLHHDYTLLDAKLPAGATLLYYRLRQTDLSGAVTYSSVRAVTLMPQAAGFVVYPVRVASGQVATYLYTGPASPGTLQVLDMLGRLLLSLPVDGRAQGKVPLGGLAAGAYLLRYTTATASFSGRCVVE